MVGVPAVWETVKKGIIANVNRGGRIVETIFWSAFYTKRYDGPYKPALNLTWLGF